MVFGAVWLACGLLAGYLYSKRGRSSVVGFLGGVILGPIGIVLALVSSRDEKALAEKERANNEERVRQGEAKKCPFCAELVKPEATVCRFCGRELPQ